MTDRRKFAWLRIAFGAVWGIDAYFKWQPDFFANFTGYLSGNLDGQSPLVKDWITLWIHVVGVNPQLFALLVALAETAIAIALIFGIASRIATWGGIAMSLVIWSTAEGFGGPYAAGSTDIGAAIIYVLVFLALWFGRAWGDLSLGKVIRTYLKTTPSAIVANCHKAEARGRSRARGQGDSRSNDGIAAIGPIPGGCGHPARSLRCFREAVARLLPFLRALRSDRIACNADRRSFEIGSSTREIKRIRCPECGLFYPTEKLAERCRKWCSEHKSCNLEIIKYALKDE